MIPKPNWLPHRAYEGMRLIYKADGGLNGHVATAHKNNEGQWYVSWDHGGRSNSGDDSGIRDRELGWCWKEIEEQQTTQHIDVKFANTRTNVTNCVQCQGPLKDIGMGPQFKYCPVCEP